MAGVGLGVGHGWSLLQIAFGVGDGMDCGQGPAAQNCAAAGATCTPTSTSEIAAVSAADTIKPIVGNFAIVNAHTTRR
ncbi:hypothetical protein SAMN05444159_5541 [Bradyrhizobium lablabi]|uniref:Uncharacterized protein n=1 Tax=Bradyrhizobium lablabi TaxID=722472 RepID=A0A1M6ZG57_9BRAD|nr:hypothetical protein SAMN05444159_5541 [Bradyrhizobium lablabi]